MLNGCSAQQADSNTSSTTTSTATQTSNSNSAETTTEASPVSDNTNENNPNMKNLPRLEGKATVEMEVNGSTITMELDGANAPITAGNFVDLVQNGVYDVFQDARSGDRTFLGHMADQEDGNPAGFGQLAQARRAFPYLGY